MQFFDRPGRSKIALGGSSSRPPTSEELLARARKAREERRHKRQQHHAATSIQAVFRRHVAVRRNAAHLRTQNDPRTSLQRLLFVAGVDAAQGSVAENVAFVQRRVGARPFLGEFVAQMGECSVEDVSAGMIVKAVVVLVEWARRRAEGGEGVQEVIGVATRLLGGVRGVDEQVRWGLYVHVANLVGVGVEGVGRLVEVGMGGEVGGRVYKQFGVCLLGIEGVFGRFEWGRRQPFIGRAMKAMAAVGEGGGEGDLGEGFEGLDEDGVAVSLGNLLELGDEFWQSRDKDMLWAYIGVLSRLIEKLPYEVVEEEEGEGGLGGTMRRLSLSLKKVVSEDVVRTWMNAAVADGVGAVIRVCQLFNFLTRRERGLKTAFQNALAFWRGGRQNGRRHILNSLWRLCVRSGDNGVMSDSSADFGTTVVEESLPILLVFARAYSYLLYIQDVDEMFESKWPFSVDEVREIVLVLKQCLFYALYVRPNSVSRAMHASSLLRKEPGLVDEVSRLLSRLYVCDSRRQFRTGDDFWLAGRGSLSSEAFLEDAKEAGPQSLAQGSTGNASAGIRQTSHANARQQAVTGAGELLRVAPYLVPFSARAKIFQGWIAQERDIANGGQTFFPTSGRSVSVRRNYMFDDAFEELNGLGAELKATIRVKFIDEHGMEEPGIDGGGVFKEFMYEVLRAGFSPYSYGLFKTTPDGRLYPSPDAVLSNDTFRTQFAFLGRLLGKAVFDGVLVDIPLARFFISKILGQFNYPTDLGSLDPQLYKSMKFLKNCPPEVVEDLGLNFTVVNSAFGKTREVELIPNGKNVLVTSENRIEYIHRVANYRMNTQIKEQSEAFLRGFSEIVAPEYIRLFSHEELQLLISGKSGKIDLDDLRRNTKYSGGYSEDTMVIKWFWQAMSELNAEDQSKMLQFVTSSPRAPLLGFSYLVPSFCIHRAEGDIRLPTASTCMNLLKLPEYKSFDVVREKLQYALKSNAGFDLS